MSIHRTQLPAGIIGIISRRTHLIIVILIISCVITTGHFTRFILAITHIGAHIFSIKLSCSSLKHSL